MKVSTRELKEQVLSPDESSVSTVRIARQARSERNKEFCFRFSEKEQTSVFIDSMARWEEHLKRLVVLERHCLALREEVEHLNERQEVLAILMEGKMMNMQKVAPEVFQRQIFHELQEL